MLDTKTYDELDALNWSSLKHIAISPLHFLARQKKAERKKVFVHGSAIHCAALEPEEFDKRYGVYPGKTRRGKEFDDWLAAHPGIQSLLPAEMAMVKGCAASLLSHRIIGPALRGARYEVTIEWTDAFSGLKCKGRLDTIKPPRRLSDLKSARDIDPRNFRNATGRYLYHASLTWYRDGAIAAGLLAPDCDAPRVIVVQKVEPYDCGSYYLTDADMDLGRAIYRHLLKRFLECTEANFWPGILPDERPLDAPTWSADMVSGDEDSEVDF